MSKDKKKLALMIWGVAAVLIVGFIVSLFIISKEDSEDTAGETTVTVPVTVDQYGAFKVSSEGVGVGSMGTPELYIFFDPICPGCSFVDELLYPTYSELVEKNELVVNITPLAFMDQTSTDDYSSRAVSAMVTVAEYSPDHFLPFIRAVFDEQPAEGPDYVSVSNDDLVEIAKSVGVPSDIAGLIRNEEFKGWAIENTSDVAKQRDVFPEGLGTPSIFVNLRDDDGKVINPVPLDFDTDLTPEEYLRESLGI